jgi:hypothetical protein
MALDSPDRTGQGSFASAVRGGGRVVKRYGTNGYRTCGRVSEGRKGRTRSSPVAGSKKTGRGAASYSPRAPVRGVALVDSAVGEPVPDIDRLVRVAGTSRFRRPDSDGWREFATICGRPRHIRGRSIAAKGSRGETASRSP